MATPSVRATALLPLLLLLAALHAASAALIRPLYQVSDEVNYIASAQRDALASTADASLAACVSPPDGRPPLALVVGGKALFHRTGGTVLLLACRAGAGDAAPIVARLLFSLSLVLVTWCGWHVASLLAGGTLVPALTALALATQPVLAKYAGAVSPDSLANAAAAVAILLTVRWLVRGPSLLGLLGIIVASGLAAGFKDTALALVPVHGLVLAASVGWSLTQSPQARVWRLVLALAVIAVVPTLVLLTRTPQAIGPGMARAFAAPMDFAGAVVADTVGRLPVLLTSSWTSLGGFGGTSADLPTTAAVVIVALWALALTGLCAAWLTTPQPPVAVIAYLALLGLFCLIQAPTRQVLLGMTDQHQGRWLFPLAVPIAVGFATGLARLGGVRSWPLVTMASLFVLLSAALAVVQWHVTSPAWTLDRPHLYLHSTGGLDIGVARTADQVRRAWLATHPPLPALLTLLCCTICGALLLRRHPSPDTASCPPR